jgi:hypothetical protein
MRMIYATFHCARKYPLSKISLNNWVREIRNYFSGVLSELLSESVPVK